jgi:hypothetical protein
MVFIAMLAVILWATGTINIINFNGRDLGRDLGRDPEPGIQELYNYQGVLGMLRLSKNPLKLDGM